MNGSNKYRYGIRLRVLSILAVLVLFMLPCQAALARNQKPVAVAGSDRIIGLGETVYLDGGQSYDSDGAIERYRWKQVKGQRVLLQAADTVNPYFVSPNSFPAKVKLQKLRFNLIVVDDRKKRASATVTFSLLNCASPNKVENGACKAPEPIPVCLPPNRRKNGICSAPEPLVCEAPLVPIAGVCLYPALECVLPMVEQNGVCAVPAIGGVLNDTGIVDCSDAERSGDICPLASFPGQDAEFGRDKWQKNDNDGRAGFSFQKLDANGQALPMDVAEWWCVQDKVTGLVWEVKTKDGDLHDTDRLYSNFTAGFDPDGEYNSSSDAAGFVNAVNEVGLCGASDWRLPTVEEMQGIVDYGRLYPGPAIDQDFFPNGGSHSFWTGVSDAEAAEQAWVIYFDDGRIFPDTRKRRMKIRLVRNGS